ncbi:hypothetical protein AKJ16_DCAP05184 [Drosera capensis]
MHMVNETNISYPHNRRRITSYFSKLCKSPLIKIKKMEEEKATALAQMKQAVRDLGSSTDNYLDGNLMRFLIARSMVPEKAAKMFVQWQEWRSSFVPLGYIPDYEVRDQLEERKMFLGGMTKEGYPLILVKACRHNSLSKDKLQLKSESYYPERLGKCYMLNTPWFLANMWKMISYFLDKATQEKASSVPWFRSILNPHLFCLIAVVFVYSEEEKKKFIEHLGEDLVSEEFGGKAKLVALQDVTI